MQSFTGLHFFSTSKREKTTEGTFRPRLLMPQPVYSQGTNCMHADTAQAGARTTGLFGRLTDLGYTTGVFGKVTNDQTRILPQLVKEGSASYIDSPVEYNSYDGLPYFRCAEFHSLWQRRVHTGVGGCCRVRLHRGPDFLTHS